MEEKGRNFMWQPCFPMGLQSPSYPKWESWGCDWRCDCLFTSPGALYCPKNGVHPTAWSEEEGACSPPRLCSTQQDSQEFLSELLGIMAQARDMDSCWTARPGCKNVSHPCAKKYYGCIPTILFQMSPSAALSVLNFTSGLNPLYVLITPRPLLCYSFGAFKERQCKSISSLWVTHQGQSLLTLWFQFWKKWLMPVLQNLYKASFNGPLPPPVKKGVIDQRLFVSLIN